MKEVRDRILLRSVLQTRLAAAARAQKRVPRGVEREEKAKVERVEKAKAEREEKAKAERLHQAPKAHQVEKVARPLPTTPPHRYRALLPVRAFHLSQVRAFHLPQLQVAKMALLRASRLSQARASREAQLQASHLSHLQPDPGRQEKRVRLAHEGHMLRLGMKEEEDTK